MLTNQPDDGKRSSLHGNWSSRMAFILAVTGSAVGLGNIWKFPYIAGQNGGGAFVLVYLFCVIAIGMPVGRVRVATASRTTAIIILERGPFIFEGTGNTESAVRTRIM